MQIDFAAIAQGGATLVIAVGLAVTWIRNGRAQGAKYGALQAEVKNTGTKVDALTGTVNDLDKKVDKFDVAHGRLDERVNTTERDIHELKGGK